MKNDKFLKLEKNICKVVKEEKIKLGYQSETIRLYYPLESLNLLLSMDCNTEEMRQVLGEFAKSVCPRLGEVQISHRGERFCICLPPEAADYVNENTPKEGFLYDLIAVVGTHYATMSQVEEVFRKYSAGVCRERMDTEDFDELLYFEDGVPDEDYYCFKTEGEHLIYHRFTKEDYQALFGK